jgi:hypothetical protein
MRTFIRGAVAALVAVTCGAHASLVTFDSIGDAATFTYSASVNGADLSATVTYTLSGWGGSTAIFHVSATNSSSGVGGGLNPNRLTSFGIGLVTPDLVGADVSGVTEWDATVNNNFPGFGTVELCHYAGANCADGAALGVYMGATDQFDVALIFIEAISALNPIEFSSPAVSRWDNVGSTGTVQQVSGCLVGTICQTDPPLAVPEPGSLALVALALLGQGLTTRLRRD